MSIIAQCTNILRSQDVGKLFLSTESSRVGGGGGECVVVVVRECRLTDLKRFMIYNSGEPISARELVDDGEETSW